MSRRENLKAEIANADAQQRLLAALEVELTPEVRAKVMEFARRRERWLVTGGVRSAYGEAAAYVADAISDTACGDVVWAPGVSLRQHLKGVIRGRTSWSMKRARAAPHVSVDDPGCGRRTRAELVAAVGAGPDPRAAFDAAEATARVVVYLQDVAPHDAQVQALVWAYHDGARDLADAIDATGLTRAEATAARKRMDRILARMPEPDDERDLSDSGTW